MSIEDTLAQSYKRDSKNTNYSQTRVAAPETEGDTALRLANEGLALNQTQGYDALLAGTPGTLGGQDQDLLGLATSGLTTAMGQGGVGLSPEQRAALDTIYGHEASELQRGLAEMARTIAAQRGLALSDSPVANPLFAETQRGLLGLGAARARGTLDFGQQGFQNLMGLKSFQENLRQQALMNRAGLLQGQPGSFAYQQGQNAFRLGQGTTTGHERTVGKSLGLAHQTTTGFDFGNLAGGFGG